VDSNNTQDAMVLCSTAAPLCDAGYSGKCIELADDAKQPLLLTPSERRALNSTNLQVLQLMMLCYTNAVLHISARFGHHLLHSHFSCRSSPLVVVGLKLQLLSAATGSSVLLLLLLLQA
jgi:hypothetical protein